MKNFKKNLPQLSSNTVVLYFKGPTLETPLHQLLYGAGNPLASLVYEDKQGLPTSVIGWETMLPS